VASPPEPMRRAWRLRTTKRARRLLIVDDEASILTGMRCFFRKLGFKVDCAQEKEEAEALLDHVAYDALIADLCLTTGYGPDGLGLIGHAREASPATRVVVLTAVEGEETEDLARSLGAHAFLRKPTALNEVADVLERLLGSQA
jgi:DNA-binding response OmpR family regulator